MNQTPEESLVAKESYEDYSRSQRHQGVNRESRKEVKKTKVPTLHKLYIVFWSALTACLSFAVLPFLADTANSLQSQNFYLGLMVTKGQLPFSDLFATGGFLYYIILAIGFFISTSLWIALVNFLAYYVTGIYLYKVFYYFTEDSKVATIANLIFYLLNLILGFGGLYPIQWAMPFVMVSLWFLIKYFAGIIKDEAFILYGFAGAAAMLLEPRTLIFWGISFITIGIYNISQKHVERGFYQLLCIILGTILVFYTSGYFILNLQILSPYISQAVIYPFTYFAVGSQNLWLSILFHLLVALVSGLLIGFFGFFRGAFKGEDKVSKFLIFLVAFIYLVIACLSQDFRLYHLLMLLPFGLILTVISLNVGYQNSLTKTSHRRKKTGRGASQFLSYFLRKHLYLPILVLILSFGHLTYVSLMGLLENAERSTIATYLTSQLGSEDKIYVWDDSAKIYFETQAQTSAQFALPTVNTVKKSNAKLLEDDLLQVDSEFVVVNPEIPMSDVLKNSLEANYDKVSVEGVSTFKIYQKK